MGGDFDIRIPLYCCQYDRIETFSLIRSFRVMSISFRTHALLKFFPRFSFSPFRYKLIFYGGKIFIRNAVTSFLLFDLGAKRVSYIRTIAAVIK
jgi:hypothetical protein